MATFSAVIGFAAIAQMLAVHAIIIIIIIIIYFYNMTTYKNIEPRIVPILFLRFLRLLRLLVLSI